MKKFHIRRIGMSDDPTQLRPSLHDCLESVLSQSDTLIDDVLQGLDAAVGQGKTKISQVHSRQISKSTVDELQLNVAAVRATFALALRQAVNQSGANDVPSESQVSFENLQFLDESQIDANIEFAVAQQEIQLAVDDVVGSVHALISSLMGWLTVQPQLNPLRPDIFARALRDCLAQHVPSEEARNGLMTPASGLLGASLRHLYRELSDWLRSHGVEPVVPLQAMGGGQGQRAAAESTVGRTMLTLDKLRRLLSGELDTSNPMLSPDFLHTVPASMVALEELRMVEPMMKRLSQRAGQGQGVAAEDADAALESDKSQTRKLGAQLGAEVVHLMLENLRQDERLLPSVRNQVQALEPVLVRLAQSDPRFFSERRHPARQLLDKLTHRSLGYAAESDPGFAAFIHSVSAAVQELAAGTGEAESFARALASLETQWSRAEPVPRPRQEEAARALIHAEQRNLLAQRVAQDLQEQLKGRAVPEMVVAFLCGPWSQVVAQSQLSGADALADGQDYLALADDLMWSVQVKRARRNRSRLVQLVPPLLLKLREGLTSIHYPPERSQVFFDGLIALHEEAFEGPRAAPAPEQAAVADPSTPMTMGQNEPPPAAADFAHNVIGLGDEVGPEAFWLAESEAAEAGYLAAAAVLPADGKGDQAGSGWSPIDLPLGSWVELALKGEWVRAQLTWASPHRTLFMFISGRGLAHSMSRRTMDKLRSRNFLRVVAGSHVVDTALDAVAQVALRNDRSRGAEPG